MMRTGNEGKPSYTVVVIVLDPDFEDVFFDGVSSLSRTSTATDIAPISSSVPKRHQSSGLDASA